MKLEEEVLWGRSFKEYRRMFSLSEEDLSKRILGCADGVASFNAELSMKGGHVVSIDPIYQFDEEAIQQRIYQTFSEVLHQITQNQSLFHWKQIKSPEALGEVREECMSLFLNDYSSGKEEGRYVDASLPSLPLEPNEFDLVLCSHFLLLATDKFDVTFHLESIRELVRISKEVRIFPVIRQAGELNELATTAIEYLKKLGHTVEVIKTDYEFQIGACEMMRITASD